MKKNISSNITFHGDEGKGYMKITRITATPVLVKLTRPAAAANGNFDMIPRTIVEVETDAGIIGLGEITTTQPAKLITMLAPLLTGIDPHERTKVRDLFLPTYLDYAAAYDGFLMAAFAGLEMALWDIAAKAQNLPLYKYLGGAVRERAPFSSYAYTVDLNDGLKEKDVPGALTDIARQQVSEMQSTLFEFKVARYSVGCDIETVQELRRALGPNVRIAVDANMRYSVDQARQFLKATANILDNIEEPCASLTECSRLRQDFGVPISTHCTDFDILRGFPHIDSVVGAIDHQGGIARTLELATIANSIGKRYWLRSSLELGVAWAAMTHVGMAFRALDRPAQGLIHWVTDDLIEGDSWLIRNDGVRAPDLPGLGVTLDHDALARASESTKGYFENIRLSE